MDTDATARLTYRGPHALVGPLLQEFHADGLTVDHAELRHEPRTGLGDAAPSTLELTVSGLAVEAIHIAARNAYARFCKRFPDALTELDDHGRGGQ